MAKECYKPKKFKPESLQVIETANDILEEYEAQGFDLTLRQLYYQFVARDLIENTMKSYNRLGSIVNDARLAGLIDWDRIEDRTRSLSSNPHWAHPANLVGKCAKWFQVDKWQRQPIRLEVWIEKEALAGVIEGVCTQNDVPFFCCRGYTSQSEMYKAADRMKFYNLERQQVVILHLGDHDPSGIDMTRDIEDRLCLFEVPRVTVKRLALNMEQVEEYGPPPNPAKLTDSRAENYIWEYGNSSWELDALEPRVIISLIQSEIDLYRDDVKWKESVWWEDQYKDELNIVVSNWRSIMETYEGGKA